jgi:hypothetical protein
MDETSSILFGENYKINLNFFHYCPIKIKFRGEDRNPDKGLV